MRLAALVPVKAFGAAKQRLAAVLSDVERERLARATAAGVLHAVAPFHPHVVCDDDEVAGWAVTHGATVIRDQHRGLNPAIDLAVGHLAQHGYDHVLVVHGDLPRPTALARLAASARSGAIVLVPDRRLDGTNVAMFPVARALAAAYGPGSFRRHLAAALATGCPVSVVRDVELALDIDQPSDLTHPLVHATVDRMLGRSDTVL